MARALAVVPPSDDEAVKRRWEFSRFGLGYQVEAKEIETIIRVGKLKRTGGDLHGDLRIMTRLAGVKVGENDLMHHARFNLSSSSARSSLANILEKRTAGKGMDWFDGLEMLCQQVLHAESVGQPYYDIGTGYLERDITGFAIDPVVPANVASLLYGPGGSGKSVLALALAISVATGRAVVPGLNPALTAPVLYLDWETDRFVINERARRIYEGAGIKPVALAYRRCIRPLADEAEEVANLIAERGIGYVVIDSAGMAMGGAGEHSDANESTLRLFDAVRHLGVTTQVIDHVSKQEMKTTAGTKALMPYGSVYKINLSRSAWELRNKTDAEDAVVSVSLIHAKANDSRLHEDINLQIEWEPGGPITFREGQDLLPVPAAIGATNRDRIIAYIRANGPSLTADIHAGTGIPEGSIRNATTDRKRNDWRFFRKLEDGRWDLSLEAEQQEVSE